MPLEDILSDIREMPPMRPVKKNNKIMLVYPFYIYNSYGTAENQAYSVELDINTSNHKIIFKKTGIKRFLTIPIETPDFIIASSLKTLYELANGNQLDTPRGLVTCRDPFIETSGSPMRGYLTAVIFDNKPSDDATIYLISGTARLVKGSCRRGGKPDYKGFNIAILYVSGPNELDECPPSLLKIHNAQPINIVLEDYTKEAKDTDTIEVKLESDSLYCYPVYPPSKSRGNKFYPATVVATISPIEHEGLSYGAVFELLVGTIFASTGTAAWNLLSHARANYPQTHFIPSPVLLSSSRGQKWHDKALTLRTQDVPLLRLKINSAAIKAYEIVKAQIIQSLSSQSPLIDSKIFELKNTYKGLIIVPRDILEKVIDSIEELSFENRTWKDIIDGLKVILQTRKDGIELFWWPNQLGSSSDIHVDPKLVAKALVNELVTYPLLRQTLGNQDILNKIFARTTAVRYRRIANISDPVASLLVGKAGTSSEILYVHARMNFIPVRLLAAMYWALSNIAGPPAQRNQRVLRDTGLLMLSWGLITAALAWKYGGSSSWHPVLLNRLADSIGAFAVLAGTHGLAHIASQLMSDSFGISRPDLYMRELTRLYLNDQNLLRARYQPDNTALLIDGALLVSPGPRLASDLSVAAAMEGLYHVVREHSFIDNLNELCNELHYALGHYKDGTCMNIWRLSVRSYLTASQAAPKDLKYVANYILDPFDLAESDMSEVYYPPPETTVYLIEKLAQKKSIPSSEVKAYASQLAKARLPLCYDACEICVMSDECPLISSPVQQQLISRSGAYLLCYALQH